MVPANSVSQKPLQTSLMPSILLLLAKQARHILYTLAIHDVALAHVVIKFNPDLHIV